MTEASDRPYDAMVTLHFRSKGGRQTICRPAAGAYRAPCDFGRDDALNDAMFVFMDKELVAPGEAVSARMRLLHPELQTGRLYDGMEFAIHEGGRIVGRGTINRVVRTVLSARRIE
jgi:translation elongation factor EF-Tu-like GTPase